MQRHRVLPGEWGVMNSIPKRNSVGGVVWGIRPERPPGGQEGYSEGFGRLNYSQRPLSLSLVF